MARIGRDHEATAPHTQQVVLPHHPQHALVMDGETAMLEFDRNPAIAVSRPLHGDLLHLVTDFHFHRCGLAWHPRPVESSPAQAGHLAKRTHSLAFRRGLLDFFKQASPPLTTAGG
jgi:hypothetical protein